MGDSGGVGDSAPCCCCCCCAVFIPFCPLEVEIGEPPDDQYICDATSLLVSSCGAHRQPLVRANVGVVSVKCWNFSALASGVASHGWIALRLQTSETGAVALPRLFSGVGPKVANLVLSVSFGDPDSGLVVDTHVHRLAGRLGWTDPQRHKTAEHTRRALERWVPKAARVELTLMLVGFGQEVCKPTAPQCADCPVNHLCPSAFGVQSARQADSPKGARQSTSVSPFFKPRVQEGPDADSGPKATPKNGLAVPGEAGPKRNAETAAPNPKRRRVIDVDAGIPTEALATPDPSGNHESPSLRQEPSSHPKPEDELRVPVGAHLRPGAGVAPDPNAEVGPSHNPNLRHGMGVDLSLLEADACPDSQANKEPTPSLGAEAEADPNVRVTAGPHHDAAPRVQDNAHDVAEVAREPDICREVETDRILFLDEEASPDAGFEIDGSPRISSEFGAVSESCATAHVLPPEPPN